MFVNKTHNKKIIKNPTVTLDIEANPSIFLKKSNNDIKSRPNSIIVNTIGPTRHTPASTKEWFNSIYTYNNKTAKDLPSLDKSLSKIIKSYFNSSLKPLYKNSRFLSNKRLRIRYKRLSLNNIFVGKAEMKHTYDKVIITLFVFDGERSSLIKNFNQFRSVLFTNYKQFTLLKQNTLLKNMGLNTDILNFIRAHFFKNKLSSRYFETNNSSSITSMYAFQKADANFVLLNNSSLEEIDNFLAFTSLSKSFFGSGDIIKKLSQIKKIIGVYLKPLTRAITYLILNQNKFNKYIFRLTPLISKLYGKKVEFNIVKLKTLYHNSDIFTQVVSVKLKNRDNRLLRVMRSALSLIRISDINRIKDKYGRQEGVSTWINQVKNLRVNSPINFKSKRDDVSIHLNDILSLNKETKGVDSEITDYVCNNLKYKIMAGARLEARGRLTRRFTASRSVFKVRWKGGLKDPESRYKGITAVILRGHARGNMTSTVVNSKSRNGAFGVKGWISAK